MSYGTNYNGIENNKTETKMRWSDKACPRWGFTIFHVSERLGCSVRHARRLLKKFDIPTGLLKRPVRLRDGKIVNRRFLVLTETSLEMLLIAHGGLRLARTSLYGPQNENLNKSDG